MLRHIPRDFPAARGVADMNRVAEVQVLGHGEGIRREVVQVVAVRDLRRAAMAAPVMRDDAIAVLQEEQKLRVPVVGRQRPSVMEHDRLGVARAPVLVEDLDAVAGRHIGHGGWPSCIGAALCSGRARQAGESDHPGRSEFDCLAPCRRLARRGSLLF